MSKPFVYLSLVAIMMIWGLNVIALKILVNHFSPVTLTSFRIFTAGLVVILILFFITLRCLAPLEICRIPIRQVPGTARSVTGVVLTQILPVADDSILELFAKLTRGCMNNNDFRFRSPHSKSCSVYRSDKQ
jgi:hypothetical protein